MDQEGSQIKKIGSENEATKTEDPISSSFPNEIMEGIVTNMTYRDKCTCQVASRGFQTLVKAVLRSQTKWPEFMAAVQKKKPAEYQNICDTLMKFDEKSRVLDRSNNYYWYQKCPVCMKSKEMDIIKETSAGMTMKCSLCEEAYGCAIIWSYSFNTVACAGCRMKLPKGFSCSNCKRTYCQNCKFYDKALNAYGWAEDVCTRCVRECGHGCDWAYVVGHAEECSSCNQKLCGRCAHYGSDCLDQSDDEDEEGDEGDEEDDEEENEEGDGDEADEPMED